MSDRPARGEYDADELMAVMRRMLAEGIAGGAAEEHPGRAVYHAYVRATQEDRRHGNLAGLILFWITAGENSPERLLEADRIVNGDDPRRAKVDDVVNGLAQGTLDWDRFARIRKKGLIPPTPPDIPAPAPDAIALSEAAATLERMLAGADDAAVVAETFATFARLPVAAPEPLYVGNDMCLFQWGTYDWGDGEQFLVDFTRQFTLHDRAGDYDHMEQLSATLLFDPKDVAAAALGRGDFWSDDDLDAWIERVRSDPALAAVAGKPPARVRVELSEV